MLRSAFFSAILLSATLAAACGERPDAVAQAAFSALERGELESVLSRIDPGYIDPLGDRSQLESDLRDLIQSTGRTKITLSELTVLNGATRREARIVGRIDVELIGPVTWRATGPLELDLRDDGGFHITGGFLSDLRDVRSLAARRRAALEANDPTLYGKLLHPAYRDGDVDREETEARIVRDLSATAKIRFEPSLYQLEVRGPLAHLDEHYLLSVNDRALPPSIARFTLRPAAGFWRIAAGLYPEPERE